MTTSLINSGSDKEKLIKLIEYEKELFKHYELLTVFVCAESKLLTLVGDKAEDVLANFNKFIAERKNNVVLGKIRNIQVKDINLIEGKVSINFWFEEFVLINPRKLRMYKRIEKGYLMILHNIENYKVKNNIKNII